MKKSDPVFRAFYDIQESMNLKPTKINKDCTTRWSSTYFMLNRVIKLRKVLEEMEQLHINNDFYSRYGIVDELDV